MARTIVTSIRRSSCRLSASKRAILARKYMVVENAMAYMAARKRKAREARAQAREATATADHQVSEIGQKTK
jgi:hypothetical protein